jgi:hypothetical protein
VTGLPSLSNIAELIRHGQITVGVIRPMGCVAIANDAHQSLAMLVRRKGESLPQLLERLDLAGVYCECQNMACKLFIV